MKRLGMVVLIMLSIPLADCGGDGSGGLRASAETSSINVSPGPVVADGRATADINVILRSSTGSVLRKSAASVKISVGTCSNCTLSYTDKNGIVSGTLSSKTAGIVTLSLKVNGDESPHTATVSFVAGPLSTGRRVRMSGAPARRHK